MLILNGFSRAHHVTDPHFTHTIENVAATPYCLMEKPVAPTRPSTRAHAVLPAQTEEHWSDAVTMHSRRSCFHARASWGRRPRRRPCCTHRVRHSKSTGKSE